MFNDVSAGPSSQPQANVTMVIDQDTNENDSTTDKEAYEHILRLLSMSVNASLSELGHFPGSGMLLQELRKQNEQFREMTTKLHEDNVTLQRIIEKQKQDIAALQKNNVLLVNQAEEIRRNYMHLDNNFRKVIIERDNLVSYTHVLSQNPPMWSAEPFPQPIPYGMHPMQYVGPPPVPMIQGYNMEQAPRPTDDPRGGQVMTNALVRAPIISSQTLPAAPRPPRTATVIDLTANEETSNEERERKRPRHTAPEDQLPLATPTTPHVDLSQLGQQILQIEQESVPQDIPVHVPEQQPQPSPQTEEGNEEYEDEERDADGLIPISKCIETAYDERDGRMWCKMCEFRRLKAVTEQPPTPMPTNDEQDLVRHLEEVHPAGWKRLRHQ